MCVCPRLGGFFGVICSAQPVATRSCNGGTWIRVSGDVARIHEGAQRYREHEKIPRKKDLPDLAKGRREKGEASYLSSAMCEGLDSILIAIAPGL